jgi:cytochrome P450
MYPLLFTTFSLIFLLYKVLAHYYSQRKYLALSTQRGCLPPPTLHSTNLLSTSVLKASIAATKADRGPQFIVSAMNSLSDSIHTLRIPVLHYEMLITRDAENVKAIFGTNSADWDISPLRANAFMPLLGEGIFTSRGAAWRHSRALVRPQFVKAEVGNLELVDGHVQSLIRILKSKLNNEGWTSAKDLQPLFFFFSLDTVTEFLYGQSVNSQSAMAGEGKGNSSMPIDGGSFAQHLDEAKHLVDKRGALQKFYWFMPMKKMRYHCGEVHKVINFLIQDRLSTVSRDEKSAGRKFVLLDELAKETHDTKELRNETLHTLTAGRDTTGALCGWIFYMLARHPKVFSKLRDIVLEEFGSSSTSMENMTLPKLRQCEYLQHVINETIRVVSIIAMNERTALRDTVLPTGGGEDGRSPIFVREGVQVLIPKYALQHRQDIWGEDANTFRPERWEGRSTGWEWIPFGGGPRKCLGRKFFCILFD